MAITASDLRGVEPDVKVFDLHKDETLPELWSHLGFPRPRTNSPLITVLQLAREKGCRWILSEPYISTDYADEFSVFYGRIFRHIPRLCKRLHFFSELDTPISRRSRSSIFPKFSQII